MARFNPIISTSKHDVKPKEVQKLWISVGWCGKDEYYSPQTVKAAINNTMLLVTARNENRELIGMARVFGDQFFTTYIAELIVHPDYQKCGIGKKLVQKVKEKYKHTTIMLETFERNRKFFRKCGFREQKLVVFYSYD